MLLASRNDVEPQVPGELPALYRVPTHLPPLVRICYELAKEAHHYGDDGLLPHKRRKFGDVDLDYITHPVATLNILLKADETDPLLLGAALLHDVLEDCGAYLSHQAQERGWLLPAERNDPQLLRHILQERFEQAHHQGELDMPSAQWMSAAKEVSQLVAELTSENNLGKRKRVLRTLSTMEYSQQAAKIKLAELAASLADDIIFRSNRDQQAQLDYNDYVWAVAKTAAKVADSKGEPVDSEKISHLFNLVRMLHTQHQQLLDFPQAIFDEDAKERLRSDFSLDRLWAQALTLPRWQKGKPAERYVRHPLLEEKTTGLVQVGFSAEGQVTRLRMLFNPDSEALDEAFSAINRLTRAIEAYDPDNAVGYGKDYTDECSGQHQLKLKLRKPMPLAVFWSLASQAGAVSPAEDQAFMDEVNAVSRRMVRAHTQQRRGLLARTERAAQGWLERVQDGVTELADSHRAA